MTDQENDMEELTLSEAAAEFKIKRNTLNSWVWQGKLPARAEFTELGVKYYLIRRGEITKLLRNRKDFGRPLKRA